MNSDEYLHQIVPMLEAYPNMGVTQLGMTVLMLGAIRSNMGHEDAESTLRDYIHKSILSPDVAQCVEFLEREILALKRSRVDIDYWKIGNTGAFRDN